MNASPTLAELEEDIERLSVNDQLLLIERVSQRIRGSLSTKSDIETQLNAMAADPEIQKEIRDIERDFASTEEDGLDDA